MKRPNKRLQPAGPAAATSVGKSLSCLWPPQAAAYARSVRPQGAKKVLRRVVPRHLAFIALAALLTAACSSPRWRASVYPSGTSLGGVRDLGEFPTLDECRVAALQYLSDIGASDRGDYECGKNCRADTTVAGTTLYICEETAA